MGALKKTGYLKRMIAGILGLLIVIVALLALFRTASLEFVGKLALNSLGFEDVRLHIDQVSLDNIHITELSLGSAIQGQDIYVRFELWPLLKGELGELKIGALTVDLSKPREGAIAEVLQLVGASENAAEDSKQLMLPSITLKQGQIFSDTGGQTLRAEIRGTLSPQMILQSNALVTGSMETAAGPVLLESLQLSVHADVAAQTAELKIDSGILRHGSEEPEWAILSLSGVGSLADEKAEFELGVQTASGQSLLQLSGLYDIAAKTGSAKLKSPALKFNRHGLQPSDLTRHAKDFPPFDGLLSTDVTVTLEGLSLTYDVDVKVAGLALEQNGAVVTAEMVPLVVSGTYSMENGTQQAGLSLPDTDVVVTYDRNKYQLKKLSMMVDVDNFGERLELKSFSGSAVQVAKNTKFIPLEFHASGQTLPDGNFRLQGAVFDKEERLMLNLTARQNLKMLRGALFLELLPVNIGEGALQLSKISTYLKDFPKDLSGIITGAVELSHEGAAGIHLVSATAGISEADYSKDGAQFTGLSLQATAVQQQADGLIKGDITGQVDEVTLNNQTIAVPGLLAKFQVPFGPAGSIDTAKMTFEYLKVEPKDGAFFKEALTATGTATLKNEKINFSAAISSDLLGPFSKIEGRHALKSAAGSAQIDISPLTFEKGGVQPFDLFALADPTMILTGKIEPEATINWSSKGTKGKARVNLVNLSMKTDSGEFSDLNGAVDIDELFPLTISEPQEITAVRAVAGVSLQQPEIRFRVLTTDGFPVLFIDRMTVGVVGGSAIIDHAVIDTGAEVNRMTVQLTSLDLEEVMALGQVEELRATGSISGTIPLIFGGDRLLVDTGVLRADGPGVLKMKSEAARQALAGGGDQANLLLDILENFQYSELSLKIAKTETGEDSVKLHATGGNPDIENNRPVILNINLTTSLDKIFNAVLSGYLLSEKALRATVEGRKNE